MAWIESHQTLKDHPKLKRLRRRLGIPAVQAIGHLHILWWWALDFAQEGELSGYDCADIADAADWEGDAERFFEALVEAGFIDRDEAGVRLHDWWDYAGKLIERRRKDAERKRKAPPDDSTGYPQEFQRISDGKRAESISNRNPYLNPNQERKDLRASSPPGADDPPQSPAEDSDAYKLAVHLRAAILHRDPETRVPAETPQALKGWTQDADRLLRLDKRPLAEAARLIEWAQSDDFWCANILSMGKFRKRYDTLKRQAKARASPHAPDGETAVHIALREARAHAESRSPGDRADVASRPRAPTVHGG